MSLRATLWALDKAPVKNPTAVLVLVALADEAGDDGTGAFPSVRTIAHRARVSERSVQNHLKELYRARIIDFGDQSLAARVIPRADQRPRVWTLNLSATWENVPPPRTEGEMAEYSRGAGSAPRSGDNGVQDLHPATNPDEVQNLHPAATDEVKQASPGEVDGVKPATERGEAGYQNGVKPASPDPLLGPDYKDPNKRAASQRADDPVVQPTLDGTTPKPTEQTPTVRERAFGIARGWIDYRTSLGLPPVMRNGNPLHALAKLITPALEADYTDSEVKKALMRTDTSLPSAQQFERALAEVRQGVPSITARRGGPDPAALRVNDHWDRVAAEQAAGGAR